MDLTDPDLIRTVREAGRHLLPLNDYLRRLPVIPDGKHDSTQFAQIRAAELFLADRSAWSDSRWFGPIYVPGLIGLRAIAAPRPFRNLVVLEGEAPVACIRNGLPFVAAGHRGRGIGALLVLISDLNGGRFLCPVSYSEAGFRARRSAHALQVRIVAGAEGSASGGSVETKTGAEAPVPVS